LAILTFAIARLFGEAGRPAPQSKNGLVSVLPEIAAARAMNDALLHLPPASLGRSRRIIFRPEHLRPEAEVLWCRR